MNLRYFTIGTIVVIVVWLSYLRPPLAPIEREVYISPGGVSHVAEVLKKHDVIVSADAFSLFAILFGGARYGTYTFTNTPSVIEVAWRVARGIEGTPLVKVTVPEGSSNRDVARILSAALPAFDAELFVKKALRHEGYLFPDTYYFSPSVSPDTVIEAMRDTYLERTGGTPTRNEVIMASLLEKEARKFETRQMIAGILWKRLEVGMPLQVDAVFAYIEDKPTFSPTFDQLKVESPYNTYTNVGLPPGPIGNPGLEALRAAMQPTESQYWYYLTGVDGTMHYATTFDQHVANRQFLR